MFQDKQTMEGVQPSNSDIMNAIFNIGAQLSDIKQTIEVDREKANEKILTIENRLESHDSKLLNYYKRDVKRNIVIFGWDEMLKNPLHIIRGKLLELIVERLEVKDVRMFDIHGIKITGPKKNVLVVTLCSPYLTRIIISNGKKLAGTKIFIDYDLSPEERANKKKLLNHKKAFSDGGIEAKLKNNTLIVGDKTYTLEQLEAGEFEIPNASQGTAPSAQQSSSQQPQHNTNQTPRNLSPNPAENEDFEMGTDRKKRTPPLQENDRLPKKFTLNTPKINVPNFPLENKTAKET